MRLKEEREKRSPWHLDEEDEAGQGSASLGLIQGERKRKKGEAYHVICAC